MNDQMAVGLLIGLAGVLWGCYERGKRKDADEKAETAAAMVADLLTEREATLLDSEALALQNEDLLTDLTRTQIALAVAQKNDTPKDPVTGRFVAREGSD